MANPKLIIDIDGNSKPLEADLNSLKNIAKTTASAMAVAFGALSAAFVGVSSKAIGLASNLQEIQNVVDVTFGDSATIVNDWAKTAQDAFGISELQAKRYSSTLGAMYKSMGLTSEQTLEMSTSMAGLTGDMASFYNLDHETAFQKLQSGISGEIEPLRQLGINLSVANLEAFAMSEGITKAYKDMTEAEKATLRYNYILNQTSDAQGDFARTADSYANQLRSAGVELENLGKSFGEILLPIATNAVEGVRSAIASLSVAFADPKLQQSIRDIGENMATMIASISEFVADVIPDIIAGFATLLENIDKVGFAVVTLTGAFIAFKAQAVIGTIVTAFIALTNAIKTGTVAQYALNAAMAANPIALVVTAIGAVVGALIYLWNTNDSFRIAFLKGWSELVLKLKLTLNELILDINTLVLKFNELSGTNIQPLRTLDIRPQTAKLRELNAELETLKDNAVKADDLFIPPSNDGEIQGYIDKINELNDELNNMGKGGSGDNGYNYTQTDFVGPLIDENLLEDRLFVGPEIDPQLLADRVASEETASRAGSIIADAITGGIASGFDEDTSIIESIGQNLIQSLADSMINWANSLLTDAMSTVGSIITTGIKGALGIQSPSKVFAEIGKFNMQGLAKGMTDNAKIALSGATSLRNGLVSAMSGASNTSLSLAGAGGGGSGIIINNINQAPNVDVQTTQKTNANGTVEITNTIISVVATDISKGGTIGQAIDYRNSTQARVNR